jgi:hypothetical protein
MPFEMFELQEHDETGEFKNAYLDFMQNNSTFDDFIGRKKEKAAKKKMENTLNAFIDDEVIDGAIDTPMVEGIDSGFNETLPSDFENTSEEE